MTFASNQAAPGQVADPARATATLREKASTPGTAWVVDQGTNRVSVTADSTVTGARWDDLVSTVESMGPGVRLERAPGFTVVTGDGRRVQVRRAAQAQVGRQVRGQRRRDRLTSGGSRDCRGGGVTFFSPVTTELAAVNARIDDRQSSL